MKIVNCFDDYVFEGNDLVNFIISPELEEKLKLITNVIANVILKDSVDRNSRTKITYLDMVDDDPTKWSFVNSIKVIQDIEDSGWEVGLNILMRKRYDMMTKYNSITKIGRIINKLYPNRYTASDIEEFVTEYKKTYDRDFSLVGMVEGEDIKYWYSLYSYNDFYPTGEIINETELNQSCMCEEKHQPFLDFYAVNKDSVQMVLLYADDTRETINARALVWKPSTINGKKNTNGVLFMDRVYYNFLDNKITLQKYAEGQGWYYKKANYKGEIYNPYNTRYEKVTFTVDNIKYPKNHLFPYLDTLDRLDVLNNTLISDEDDKYIDENNLGYLSSTEGEIENVTWVDKYNSFLPNHQIRYVEGVDGTEKVKAKDAIHVPVYKKVYTQEYVDKQGGMVDAVLKNGEPVQVFKNDSKLKEDGTYEL